MALTLVVEDGTGIAGANSYITLEEAKAYNETIFNSTWEDNCSLHVIALINASRYIDQRYGARFPGKPLTDTQGLLYPRTANCSGDTVGIPTALKNAVAHAAMQFIDDGGLDLNPNQGNNIKSSAVSVGGGAVSESVSYFAPQTINVYASIDAFMATLFPLNVYNLNIKTVRG